MNTGTPNAGGSAERMLEVSYPELQIVSYLRLLAWSEGTAAALLSDPALESVARANGVRVLDRSVQRLASMSRAAFADAAAAAVRGGRSTVSLRVSAPMRLWSEGIGNTVRFTEWVGSFRGSVVAGLPKPTREVEATFRKLLGATQDAYAAAT